MAVVGVIASHAARAQTVQDDLGEMAEGVVALEDATRLRIRGITGRISARAGRAGEVRFLSTLVAEPTKRSALRLRREPGILEFGAPAAPQAVARVLEISLPSDVGLEVSSSGSRIAVRSIQGGIQIEGDSLDLALDAVGTAGLVLRQSQARVAGIGGTLTVDGTASSLEVNGVRGRLFVTQSGGTLLAKGLAGDAELDLGDVALTVQDATAGLSVRAEGGKIELEKVMQGGDLKLTDAPLELSECGGEINVETNAAVRFENLDSALHVDGYGASVTGTGNSRLVEIVTDGAEVDLRQIRGPVRIQGANLGLSLDGIGGELIVLATSSTISIAGASAPVTVQNEFGDIAVDGAYGGVRVVSSDGDVHLTKIAGPVDVESNGAQVLVSWTTLDDKDSYILNDGGDVDVVFPSRARCRVEATSHFGRVNSEIPDAPSEPDGNRATGNLNQGESPVVRIESRGSIHLSMAQPPRRGPRPPRNPVPQEPTGVEQPR